MKPTEFMKLSVDERRKYLSDQVESFVLQRCRDAFGYASQRQQTIEECAELIQVLAKEDRANRASSRSEIIGEIVDVELMVKQLIAFLSADELKIYEQTKTEKLTRVSMMLDKIDNRKSATNSCEAMCLE